MGSSGIVETRALGARIMSTARVRSLPHTSYADLVVIGGGPAGMSVAATAASHGYEVVVLEEHPTVGDPVHCTGVLAAEAFDELGLTPSAVLNDLRHVCFQAPG